jgi:cellulose synthase/poly-beta-1,6-N-acetylglucosamine synthase-like glycosyltransferase
MLIFFTATGYMTVMFWLAVLVVWYAYVGYFVVLAVLDLFRGKEAVRQDDESLPTVSLVISAYNEEGVIAEKLRNSLALDYPEELLEIVVVSDGSQDATQGIVGSYADQGVVLRHYEGHIGKTACLNRAVPEVKGEIVVFSDANSQYDRHALRHLVKRFADARIGWVTGRTEYISAAGDRALSTAGLYSRIERSLKVLESRIGSCVGADGAIFAIRKSLYRPLKDYDINDFVIPAKIIQQGFRGVLVEDAYCVERAAGSVSGEFVRHVRITARSLRAIFTHSSLLNPFRYPLFSFELVSHKLMKFLVPFALPVALVFNGLIVAMGAGPFYIVTLSLQVVFYALWLAGWLKVPVPFLSRPASVVVTFCTVNLAILLGWIKYFRGETFTTWATGR